MAEINQNAKIYQSTDINLIFKITNDINIEGYNAYWGLYKTDKKTEEVVHKTTSNVDEITVHSDKFVIHLKAGDTNIATGNYYHEARLTDSDGLTNVVSKGIIMVEKSLTHK